MTVGSGPDAPRAAASICIGCGLCCDGTVVTHLAVADESDLGAPLRMLGVEVEVAAEPPSFALPCPAVADGRCTIHDLHRPSACAQFECRVSAAVLDGSMTIGSARAIIARAFALRDEVVAGRRAPDDLEQFLDREFRWWVGAGSVPP